MIDCAGALENEGEWPMMKLKVFLDHLLPQPLEKSFYLGPREAHTFEDGFWQIKNGEYNDLRSGHIPSFFTFLFAPFLHLYAYRKA